MSDNGWWVCPVCGAANPPEQATCENTSEHDADDSGLTPQERSLRARLAVHASWARTTDRAARTRPATDASPVRLSYWERRVDPNNEMDEATRAKAAENARKAHYQRMAYRSARARRKSKGAA